MLSIAASNVMYLIIVHFLECFELRATSFQLKRVSSFVALICDWQILTTHPSSKYICIIWKLKHKKLTDGSSLFVFFLQIVLTAGGSQHKINDVTCRGVVF